MRKSNTQPLYEVIHDLLKEMDIDRKLREVSLVSRWESIMGRTVALRTKQVYIRNRVLFIHVTSSVLKNELIMMRQDILDRLNDEAGEKIIDQIVIR